ncbi:hypothetical protein FJZ31_01515 [Candidatus Poribacteria bacterium]|nr:hypothetical protein [Candidatus Poribacteria bacterium]
MEIELELEFTENAFKHGITEDEIWEIFLNETIKCIIIKYKTDRRYTIYNAYGVTFDGRYLEIGYIKRSTSTYRVIHAMDMKDSSKKRFKKIRRLL